MRREFLAAERRVKVKQMGFWAFSNVFADERLLKINL